jgi:quercetin dioxygenase-like cupin family protein
VTIDPDRYFAANESAQQAGGGTFVTWEELSPIEMLPGLAFQPVLGEKLLVAFVRFAPNTVAPVHWHDEEQITFVLEGEFEFEVGGDKRIVRRGEAIVTPPNVPHGARTYDTTCLEVDVFHPPRRGLLEAMGKADAS